MIIGKNDRVLVQGITGKQGTFWTERMQEYGTNVVAGVHPKKAGITHCNVPVFGCAVDTMKQVGFDYSILFIPPMMVKDAALDAIEAGARGVCILTEHIPVRDTMYVMSAARERGVQILGPNTAGCVTPGEAFLGFMPAFNPRIFKKGHIGVLSRSGSLGTLFCLNVVSAGFGQSAFIGIGGDPIIGTTTRDALMALDREPQTKAIVIVGEIGGTMEEEAAVYAASMKKPVIAFIAGGAAPAGKKMGHAGAIVVGDKGTYKSKRESLEAAGVSVLDTPAGAVAVLRERLGDVA
jgi:succinyl-CoA synthetase alpha subunit